MWWKAILIGGFGVMFLTWHIYMWFQIGDRWVEYSCTAYMEASVFCGGFVVVAAIAGVILMAVVKPFEG